MFRTAVFIVTVTGTAEDPVGVTGFGVITQVAPTGRPWQTRFMGWLNPLTEVTFRVNVADWPAEMVALGELVSTEKSGTVEVLPDRLATMLCGD